MRGRGREGEGEREGGGGRGRNIYIPIYSANLIPYIQYMSHSSIWVHVTGVSDLPPGLHRTSPEGALPASWRGPERAPPVHCSAARNEAPISSLGSVGWLKYIAIYHFVVHYIPCTGMSGTATNCPGTSLSIPKYTGHVVSLQYPDIPPHSTSSLHHPPLLAYFLLSSKSDMKYERNWTNSSECTLPAECQCWLT